MKVLLSGASGLIGRALVPALRSSGHDVLTLVRRPPRGPGEVEWDPAAGRLEPADVGGVEAAVHLAGAGIGDRRWTPEYRRVVLDSRVRSTRLLASVLADLQPRPRVLLSGSAVGFYGDTGSRAVDESAPQGQGFLADVCAQWEQAAGFAAEAGIRVCRLRTGIVASRDGGAFGRLRPIFLLGAGGRLGTGRQYLSWIARTDEVAAIAFLLDSAVSGPVNLTAPEPVPQAELARALGRALHRPAVVPTPAFALRLAVGAFADEGILSGQRVLPGVLQAAGFRWRYPDLAAALRAEVA